MSRLAAVCSVVMLFVWAGVAQAHVTASANCAGCHNPETARAAINATKTTNTTNNPGVTAGLPLFVAHPGDTITLPFSVLDAGATGDFYAVVVNGLASATTVAGVLKPTDTMTITPDATWTARTSGGAHATQGPLSWAGATANYSYLLNIAASTPADYYQLMFEATGYDTSAGGDMWTQQQSFIVQVAPVPEPASLVLLGIAGGVLALGRRSGRAA